MSRHTRADPKSDKGHLAGLATEIRELLYTNCNDFELEQHQAPIRAVSVGTATYSAIQPVDHPEPQAEATDTPGSTLGACEELEAPGAQSDTSADTRPWMEVQVVHSQQAGRSGSLPGATHGVSVLTSDNLHLSQGTLGARKQRRNDLCVQLIAQENQKPKIDPSIVEEAADLLRHSLAANTERAYESDLRHFRDWGGLLPAPPDTICVYIASHAGSLSVATIQRRIATLSKAHEVAGLINPCRAEITKATLRGLKRKHGTAQRQAKPLMRDDLFLVLDRLGQTLRDHRDRALLLLGFAGGFRRSELVALELADIETGRQGLIVTIRRSKTDQEGEGRRIGIPHGRTRYCPVTATEAWLTASEINTGPLFRPITRHGHVAPNRLTGDAVSILLRERLMGAGINPEGYSGHSLRAGFATSAAQSGVSTFKIRAQTGHTSDAMLARYIRDGDMFINNAASSLL